jgi:serine/threonine protein kinase/lipoprotein NlpI
MKEHPSHNPQSEEPGTSPAGGHLWPRNPQSAIRNPQLCCPSAETLAAFLAAKLPVEELTHIAEHLNTCDRCAQAVDRDAGQAALGDDVRWANGLRRQTAIDVAAPLTRLNELLTDYTVVEEIGRGGMGVVYKARQLKLDRWVALKVLPALLAAVRKEAVARFRREAALAARLEHTNIIGVYDFGEVDGTLYYAMPLIEGRSLAAILREIQATGAIDGVLDAGSRSEPSASAGEQSAIRNPQSDMEGSATRGPVPRVGPQSAITRLGSSSAADRAYFRRAAEWMAEVAEALHYAHERGVIHRDIKPSNLLLAHDGRMMISDFGLARAASVETLTLSQALLGTARYMSPEQAGGDAAAIDARVDVYGVGATLYELLALRPMFAAADDRGVLDCVLNQEPAPPHRFVRQVPRELETICLKAVEKDRAARYATAKDMADDLRRWLLDLPICARRPSPVMRAAKFVRRRKLPVGLGLSAAVLLLTAGVFYAAYRSAHREAAAVRTTAAAQGVQLLLQAAQKELDAGHLPQALEQVEAGLQQEPESAELQRLQADLFDHLGRKEEALAVLEAILARHPDDWETHYRLALALTDRRRQGMSVYTPADSPFQSMAPDEWERRFRYHREQVERLKPDSAQVYCLLEREERDPRRALELLEQALERCPTLGEALLARSKRYEQLGDYHAMLLDAERTLAMRYGWGIMHAQRALALSALGRHKEAEEAFTAAIEREPQDAAWWHDRGLEKCSLGRFAEALGDANRAVELGPDFVYAYVGRARAQAGLGRLDRALADYAQALKLAPGDIEIYLERGAAYFNADHLDESVADMTRVIELAPGDARGYGNRAVAYIVLKQYDRAIADLTRCLELKPQSANAYRNRGHAHALNAQYAESFADYTQAMALEPDVPGDLSSRANLGVYLGRTAEAVADLSRLIELGAAADAALLKRGMVYELSAAPRLALADYDRVRAKDGPTGGYARLWTYLLLRQGGEDEAAAEVLASSASGAGGGAWIDRLFAFLAGRLAADELLAAAATADERAEAYYYIGRQALLDGRPDAAREAFTQCVALDRPEVLENDFAQVLLKQLESDPARAGPPHGQTSPAAP